LVAAIALSARVASALITGPYTPDANTIFLYHFDEPAGGSVTTNVGSMGGNSYSVNESPASATPPVVTTLLGGTAFSGFGNCMTNGTTGYEFGYDYNRDGAYEGDLNNATPSADALPMSLLNIGNGSSTPFTLEALVAPIAIVSGVNQEVICTDNSGGASNQNTNRGFQFRITTAGQLQFQFVGGPAPVAVAANIPTTGTHAFVPNAWYHIAVTFDGATATLYWTKLDPSITSANVIGSAGMTLGTRCGVVSAPLIIGNENRNVAGELFTGQIDEVRISNIARGAGQMMFNSPNVTISQDPASQSVDDGQPVSFSVTASSSLNPLGYQWRFGGVNILNATNSSYTISLADLTNAGSYLCVVTNPGGSSATSHVATLTVGAANFLAHRYSFTTDTTDSIGGATGTNFGNANVNAGALVLDGSTGTFMQLPGGLLHGLSAVTFDCWAAFGTSGNNCRVFDFGNTNGVLLGVGGQPENYLFFSPHTAGGTQTLTITPGDNTFEQRATGSGTLDGRTVHVTCVVDPPNKTLSIYTNGVLEAANTNMTVPLSALNDPLSFVGRSLYAVLNNDAYLTANIDEFRIYNGALSSNSVVQSDLQGPNSLLNDGPVQLTAGPTNTTVAVGMVATFAATATGHQPIIFQWYSNSIPVAGGTNSTLSFTASGSANNALFQVRATNNVTGTNYFANSSSATLTVRVPLNLTWAGVGASWDTATANWTTNGNVTQNAYTEADNVTFDNLGAAQPAVNLTQVLHPSSVMVAGSSSYTLGGTGAIAGISSLTENGSGTLTLTTSNTYSGPTTVNSGKLQVGDGSTTGTIGTGPVTNNSAIAISPAASAAVVLAAPISGSGSLTINGGAGSSVALTASNTYTGPTVVEAGVLFPRNTAALGGAGTGTTATNGGQLYFDVNIDVPGEPLTLGGAALRKGGAGTTSLGGSISMVADTTIAIDGGATLNLTNASGITAAGFNLTLNGGGSSTGLVSGPISLGAGSLTTSGTGGVWTLGSLVNNYGGKTFLNGGTLRVGAVTALGTAPGSLTADQISLNGGFLGASASFAISDGQRGITVLGPTNGFTVSSNVTLTIANPITVSGSAALTKNGNGILVLSGANSFSSGSLNIDSASPVNDGAVRITSSAAVSGVGTLAIRNGNSGFSTLQLDGSGGPVTISPTLLSWTGRDNLTPAIENLAGNNVLSPTVYTWNVNGGTYQIQCDADTLTVAGTIPFSAPAGNRNIRLSGSGNFAVTATVQDGGATNSIIKTGGGTAVLSGPNSNTGTNLVNGGVLAVDSTLGPGTVTVAGGALGGVGTISGPVSILPGGALSPGDSLGTLTVNNNLTLAGNVLIDVNKSVSPSNDLTTVSGLLTNTGTGIVTVKNLGPALAVNDSFQIFSQPVLNGIGLHVVGGGVIWNNRLAIDGSISVASTTVPHPGIHSVSTSGSNFVLSGTNGYSQGAYYVLSSTNLALPQGTWTPELTNYFDGSGNFTASVPMTPGVPQKFYRVQVP
jgi:autotransporter-associated beta strand protein